MGGCWALQVFPQDWEQQWLEPQVQAVWLNPPHVPGQESFYP